MRAVTFLPRLKSRHLRILEVLISDALQMPTQRRDRDLLVSRSVVEAVNSFDRFCRYLYVSCALGAKDASGLPVIQVSSRFANETAAVDFAYLREFPQFTSRPSYKELDWKVPAVLLRSLTSIGASNLPQIRLALSGTSRAIASLPTFRNFYAHRGQDTAVKALKLLPLVAAGKHHPTEVLLTRVDIDELLVDWLFDLQVTIDLMV